MNDSKDSRGNKTLSDYYAVAKSRKAKTSAVNGKVWFYWYNFKILLHLLSNLSVMLFKINMKKFLMKKQESCNQ